GTIAASGTLGQIIPPSIVLILLADAISNANQTASLSGGAGPSAVSVGDLFAGALVPGLILVGIYLAFLFAMSILKPNTCPPLVDDGSDPLSAREILLGLGAPLLLIIAVLGSILAGLASPTEASAIGAGGAILLAGLRLAPEANSRLSPLIIAGLLGAIAIVGLSSFADLRIARETIGPADWIAILAAGLGGLLLFAGLVAGLRVLTLSGRLGPALASASNITAMVFLILIGASLFSLVLRGYGGDEMIETLLTGVPGGMWGALALTMLVMFVLGFFLDFIEIIFVVVPLVAPPLIILGADPVWLAILMALNLQTSFLTPPFGFALFYLRGSAPEGVDTRDIWWGALPFIGLQLAIIAMVALVPSLATWLPALAAN
ncbi:MAG: TRAP transporter large permease subunit, partial [Pseudomonadota bacterium]